MSTPDSPNSAPWHDRLTAPIKAVAAALAFYTVLPIPGVATLDVRYVARCAPLVGLILGGVWVGLDASLQLCAASPLLRSVILVLAGVGITGGFHLDGAMDTADGLSVQNPERRLQVMADSVTGAFGVMAAIAILGLKTAALADLTTGRQWALLMVPAWARWGQQMAIAAYPYLKAKGKGAFHKHALPSVRYVWPWAVLLGGVGIVAAGLGTPWMSLGLAASLGCGAIAAGTAAWFARRLGGHTGDTYGAVVEWTEALSLAGIALMMAK